MSITHGSAVRDILQGVARRELWLYLGWRDVKRQYNRSILGPFWLTLSMGVMVAGLGLLYSQILRVDLAVYLPKLAIGLIVWGFVSGVITGACQVFITSGPSLRQIQMPMSIFVFQFIWGQLLTLAHNFLIYIAIAVIFLINPGLNVLLFIPALLLIVLNGIFISFILGPLCARFRDIPMIVGSVVQIAFFMTPIIWSADALPERAFVLTANPFYHFIEIVRGPLLGETGSVLNWCACLGITVIMGLSSLAFFNRYRSRIVYWS